LVPPGVELVVTDGEPTRLIEAWTGAALAVVVDAVRVQPPRPGARPGGGGLAALPFLRRRVDPVNRNRVSQQM
ncbi:MAG: hypothetical protein ACRDRJ_25285, partial [Streptosporangiaceae bacterium]